MSPNEIVALVLGVLGIVSILLGALVVDGPPPTDTDNLDSKSKKELQEILTKKGIPFGKGDNKNALISLLKATA